MIALIRKFFWIALFAAFTLGFVTLFDHGYTTTGQYLSDAQSEVRDLVAMWKPPAAQPESGDKAK